MFSLSPLIPATAGEGGLTDEVRRLREQNALLQQQVDQQGRALDALTRKVSELESASASHETRTAENAEPKSSGLSFGRINIGAEGGVGFMKTGPDGFSPNNKFRVDEARLFLEAPVWNDIYFFSEIVLAYPEEPGMEIELGELYLEFENLSKWWHQDDQLNVRLGQMYTPFGEEYLTRNAIDNPLISHSIADFWGVAPGVELYGNLGKFSYVGAVQNGGESDNGAGGDKSVAGRIGYDPNKHWHFSLSAMRTGSLKAAPGSLSAMWFGNGFFKSIGTADTTKFHANAAEADVTMRWQTGHVSGYGGWARYADNDPAGDNARDVYYYSVEAVQNLPKNFFVATRWSQVFCSQGIPIVGFGEAGDYGNSLTTELWRLSLGLGYRFSDRLVLKAEYSFERGTEAGGDKRQQEDFLGTEAAFKF